jgi:hypothetical protein
LAAYLYLHRKSGDKSVRSERREAGLVIDFNQEGVAIGVEITAPAEVTVELLNRVLRELGEQEIASSDLSPLLAA